MPRASHLTTVAAVAGPPGHGSAGDPTAPCWTSVPAAEPGSAVQAGALDHLVHRVLRTVQGEADQVEGVPRHRLDRGPVGRVEAGEMEERRVGKEGRSGGG